MVSPEIEKGFGSHESEQKSELSLIPHAKLLGEVFKVWQYPVPPGREQELIEAVNSQVLKLSPREARIINSNFGLENGVSGTLTSLAEEMGVSSQYASQIKMRALGKLRKNPLIRGYLPLPGESFGRKVFGADFWKDLPGLEGYTLVLSPSAKLELEGKRIWWRFENVPLSRLSLDELLRVDPRAVSLSSSTRGEIESRLGELFEEIRKRGIIEEPQKEPVNNLLPEVHLTKEQLAKISQISIKELGLPTRVYHSLKRAAIKTLGDLFALPPGELKEVRDFGRISALEVGRKLQKWLGLPEKEYPIAELLASCH